jgi:alpha-glucan,water dikinase
VGAKSLHLKELRERLPDWIHLPVSIALPFGTLEKVLKTKANRDVRGHYDGLLKRVEGDPSVLEDLRRTLMRLAQPHDLDSALMEVMKNAGIPTPENTERIWKCVKRVWASKWNDRAYLNRRAFAIPHDKLLMAVLIQEVVPAEMAYIIHTVHPFSGNREEVYVEAVLGFGETLAANYPGRALSCSWNKKSGVLRLLGYPSKSIGLYGKGLIFRSDSNAEDLSGYAGAGLYSSFPLDSLKEVHLNYTEEPLVQDKAFQREFLSMVGKLGVDVEEAMGSPQDIEGAFAEGRYYVVQTRSQVGLGA